MRKFSIIMLMMTTLLQVPEADAGVKDNLGIGFNIGGQRIYGDGIIQPAVDFGGEGLVNYTLRKRQFGVISSLGFSYLKSSYLAPTIPPKTKESNPNLITLDVKGVFWLLPQQIINPYIYVGLGIINFSHPTMPNRYFDGAFFMGGGAEWMINPKIGLNVSMDYRYTTGDDFDGVSGGTTDGYLNGRVGLNFYFQEKGVITNNDMFAIDASANNQMIENMDNEEAVNKSRYSTDEMMILKAHVDELNDKISEKESEIIEVKTLIASRKEKIENIEKQGPRPAALSAQSALRTPPASGSQYTAVSSEFSVNYENGLERFYARDYDATISIMNNLIQREPQNRLVSNCMYWMGEAQFGKKDYQAAVRSFEKVREYTNSPKLDDALIMAGRCYLKLGDVERATRAFNQLLEEFPDSEYVEKAEKYLSEF